LQHYIPYKLGLFQVFIIVNTLHKGDNKDDDDDEDDNNNNNNNNLGAWQDTNLSSL